MNRVALFSALSGVAIALAFHATTAKADWPKDGARIISGEACGWPVSGTYTCPFLSDSVGYWGGNNRAGLDVDYSQNHTHGSVSSVACWRPYTGSGGACTTPRITTTSGSQDVGLFSFSTLPGPQAGADLYSVLITATGGDTINSVYGITYF